MHSLPATASSNPQRQASPPDGGGKQKAEGEPGIFDKRRRSLPGTGIRHASKRSVNQLRTCQFTHMLCSLLNFGHMFSGKPQVTLTRKNIHESLCAFQKQIACLLLSAHRHTPLRPDMVASKFSRLQPSAKGKGKSQSYSLSPAPTPSGPPRKARSAIPPQQAAQGAREDLGYRRPP